VTPDQSCYIILFFLFWYASCEWA